MLYIPQLLWIGKWNKLDTDIKSHKSNFAVEGNIKNKAEKEVASGRLATV